MMRLIDADALSNALYHEAFETDSDMQKWDSGCWIRYKMFENAIEKAPTIEERKTGRWMQVEWGKTLLGKKIVTYRCSRCAEYLDFKGLNCGRGRAWYCPNCGAEMEGANLE